MVSGLCFGPKVFGRQPVFLQEAVQSATRHACLLRSLGDITQMAL